MCFISLTGADPNRADPDVRIACDNIESMHYSDNGRTIVCLTSGKRYIVQETIGVICERVDEAILRQQRILSQRKGLT